MLYYNSLIEFRALIGMGSLGVGGAEKAWSRIPRTAHKACYGDSNTGIKENKWGNKIYSKSARETKHE